MYGYILWVIGTLNFSASPLNIRYQSEWEPQTVITDSDLGDWCKFWQSWVCWVSVSTQAVLHKDQKTHIFWCFQLLYISASYITGSAAYISLVILGFVTETYNKSCSWRYHNFLHMSHSFQTPDPFTESHRCRKFIVAQESAHPLTTRGLNSGLGLPLGFSNHTKTLASASAPALAMYGLLGWKATSNMLSSNFFLWAVISWTHCLLSSCHRRMLQSWPDENKKFNYLLDIWFIIIV